MKMDGERGTSVAELAICLPLLLMIVFGIIEFGFILYDQAMITNASREGARAGIVFHHPDRISEAEIMGRVRDYCFNHGVSLGSSSRPSPSVSVTRGGPGGGFAAGDSLTVTVTYPYTFLLLPNWTEWYRRELPGDITLTAQTVMRLE